MDMNAIEARLFDSEPVRPLRRSEFRQLADLGCFGEEPVELLYGVVVVRLPPSPEHEESLYLVSKALDRAVGDRAKVRINMSFAASDISLPVPDVLVAPPGSYWRDHPGRAYLAVEVCRSSVHRDHVLKVKLYGESEVDEYWIIDHGERCVVVHRDPVDGAWQRVTRHGPGERVHMQAFPEVSIAVDDVLPPHE